MEISEEGFDGCVEVHKKYIYSFKMFPGASQREFKVDFEGFTGVHEKIAFVQSVSQ